MKNIKDNYVISNNIDKQNRKKKEIEKAITWQAVERRILSLLVCNYISQRMLSAIKSTTFIQVKERIVSREFDRCDIDIYASYLAHSCL